jgi:hypothetical protein
MQALAPDNHGALTAQGTIDLLRNRPEQAREVIERRSTEDLGMAIGGGSGDFWDALIEHALGNDGASDAALERFIENEGDSSPVEVACIYAWRGEIDPAFAWLDRALTQDPELSLVHAFEPWLDPLRDDARWESLMTRWKVAISPIQALPQ